MKCAAVGILAFALTLELAPSAAAQTSVAGRWDLTLTMPQGTTTLNLMLKQDAEKVSGELASPMGTVPVTGTLTGNDLALTANITMQGIPLQFGFAATLADDALRGTVKAGMLGDVPFTGKRAADGSAAAIAPPATAAPPPSPAPTPTARGDALDATGDWNILVKIAGADFPLTATLKQTDTRVTGTIKSMAGDVPISGTMAGQTLTIEFKAETPGGVIPITLTGELSAHGFVGKASVAGVGDVDWTGTRGK